MEKEIQKEGNSERKHGRLNTYVLSKVIINLVLIILGAVLLTVALSAVPPLKTFRVPLLFTVVLAAVPPLETNRRPPLFTVVQSTEPPS